MDRTHEPSQKRVSSLSSMLASLKSVRLAAGVSSKSSLNSMDDLCGGNKVGRKIICVKVKLSSCPAFTMLAEGPDDTV